MNAQLSIPFERPQPKLSKLFAQQSPVDSSSISKFVFWDLQNTPLPADLCALPNAGLETLTKKFAASRLTVVTEVPASTQQGADLLKALNSTNGIELYTFLQAPNQTFSGTAADYELKRVTPGCHCSCCSPDELLKPCCAICMLLIASKIHSGCV